jgi:hypothetical protein
MINAAPSAGWLWIAAIAIGTLLLAAALFYGMRARRGRSPRREPTADEAAQPIYAGNKPGSAGGGKDSPSLSHFPPSVDPEKANPPPHVR